MYIVDVLIYVYLKIIDGAQTEFCEIRVFEIVDYEEYILVEFSKRDVFRE